MSGPLAYFWWDPWMVCGLSLDLSAWILSLVLTSSWKLSVCASMSGPVVTLWYGPYGLEA